MPEMRATYRCRVADVCEVLARMLREMRRIPLRQLFERDFTLCGEREQQRAIAHLRFGHRGLRWSLFQNDVRVRSAESKRADAGDRASVGRPWRQSGGNSDVKPRPVHMCVPVAQMQVRRNRAMT